jgi:uncharacterized protein (DUF169 family)
VESQLAKALGMRTSPVAVILTDARPEHAMQFREGMWGCVASSMTAVSRGKTAVFDRQSFGCPGGGTGLGFGDQYRQCNFAIDYLLSTGSEEIASRSRRNSRMAEGERFFDTPETVRHWLSSIPFTDVESEYVVMKPLEQVTDDEIPGVVVFMVTPDQLSALVVMCDYHRGTGDGAIARFGGACQSVLFAYSEAKAERPRGVIGFFDIAQRPKIDANLLSFTAPWALYEEMEASVPGSFLELEDWLALRARQ